MYSKVRFVDLIVCLAIFVLATHAIAARGGESPVVRLGFITNPLTIDKSEVPPHIFGEWRQESIDPDGKSFLELTLRPAHRGKSLRARIRTTGEGGSRGVGLNFLLTVSLYKHESFYIAVLRKEMAEEDLLQGDPWFVLPLYLMAFVKLTDDELLIYFPSREDVKSLSVPPAKAMSVHALPHSLFLVTGDETYIQQRIISRVSNQWLKTPIFRLKKTPAH